MEGSGWEVLPRFIERETGPKVKVVNEGREIVFRVALLRHLIIRLS
jgi:hypothetical protein